MAIYINDKQVSLKEIKDYKGNDKVMNILRRNLLYIETRMRRANGDFTQSISLIWTAGKRKFNKKSGLKEGKKFVGILLTHTVNTPQGTKVVRWCETAVPQANGVIKYQPIRRKFKKVRVYGWDDIEELLWLISFSPSVRLEMDDGEVFNKNAPISVQDIGLEQRRIAGQRKRRGELNAYIHSDLSPLADSEDTIRTLAAAWGVTTALDESTPIEQVKNQFEDKVMIAEGKRDPRYNIAAFMQAINENNQFIDMQVMITRALSLKVIDWDVRTLRWLYIDDANKGIDEICRVPVSEKYAKRDYLADYLIRNPKERTKFNDAVEYASGQREERITGKKVVQPQDDTKQQTSPDDLKAIEDRIRKEMESSVEAMVNARLAAMGKVDDGVNEEILEELDPANMQDNGGAKDPDPQPGPEHAKYGPDTDFESMSHAERLEAGKALGVKVPGKKKEEVIAELKKAAADL